MTKENEKRSIIKPKHARFVFSLSLPPFAQKTKEKKRKSSVSVKMVKKGLLVLCCIT